MSKDTLRVLEGLTIYIFICQGYISERVLIAGSDIR